VSAVGKALFRDIPQAIGAIIHKTDAQSKAAQAVAATNVARRKQGLPALSQEEKQSLFQSEQSGLFTFEELSQDPIYKFGQAAGEAIEELFPENPEFQGEFLASTLPTATGQLLALALSRGAGSIAPAAVGAAQISNNEFLEAKEKGASEEEAFQQFLVTLPLGILEKIPVSRLMKRIDQMSGGGMKRWLAKTSVGSVEEAFQEVIEEIYTSYSAREIYDPTEELFDGLGEAARDGGGAAFILNGIALALGAKLRKNRDKDGNVIDPEAEAEMAAVRGDLNDMVEGSKIDPSDIVPWEAMNAAVTVKEIQLDDNLDVDTKDITTGS
jgi:hypothetical protein